MDDKTLISVRNRNNGYTGYSIPDKGIWRNFNIGETKKISLEELRQLQYQPGGEYVLENLLVVESEEALKALNMTVEPEYNYTKEDIENLLLNGTLDQLRDFLDFAPDGAIELAKEIAVVEEKRNLHVLRHFSAMAAVMPAMVGKQHHQIVVRQGAGDALHAVHALVDGGDVLLLHPAVGMSFLVSPSQIEKRKIWNVLFYNGDSIVGKHLVALVKTKHLHLQIL